MIDIRSKYQMMHYLVMDIPYNNINDTFMDVLKSNEKTSDFIIAFRVLITHYYQDLFKEVSQEDQVNILIPMLDKFYEYINPSYELYKSSIKNYLIDHIQDGEYLNTLTELISIRVMIVAASSYFKITTGKKSSKLRRLLYLINMIIIIYDTTKLDINIDNEPNISNSLTELLNKMEDYYKLHS